MDQNEITKAVADGLMIAQARLPKTVNESDCKKRSSEILDAVKSTADSVLRIEHRVEVIEKDTQELKIGQVQHRAWHKGQSNGVSTASESTFRVLKVVGIIVGAIATIGGAVWAVARIVG